MQQPGAYERDSGVDVVHWCFPEGDDSNLSVFSSELLLIPCIYIQWNLTNTVVPHNNGHIGSGTFVLC